MTVAVWGLVFVNLVLIASMVSEFFVSPNEQELSLNASEATSEENHRARRPANGKITVEVLNGCGVDRLAHDLGAYLREKNFDVVNIDNYPGGFDIERTLILDRVSMARTHARKVAEALGVPGSQVIEQMDDSMQLMVTVIIGNDYKSLKVYEAIR